MNTSTNMMMHRYLMLTTPLYLLLLLCTISTTTAAESTEDTTEVDKALGALMEAIQKNDAKGIQKASKLPSFEFAINAQDPRSGQTPLMQATLQGRKPSTIRALMNSGADASIGEYMGYTPMHGVGFQGRHDLAEVFVSEFGLNVDDVHEDGFTPLHRACWGGEERHTKTVEVLIGLGANPDKCGPEQAAGAEEGEGGASCQHPVDLTQNLATKRVLLEHAKRYGLGSEL
mmetsp:Transcript_2464/g.3835  ORF Transcript_2464/g.3835 Transcript_2464/m.3835 type:complete len:230 (+) Transcript_2464:24-713(+)